MSAEGAENFWDKNSLVDVYSNKNVDLFRPTTSKIQELAEKLLPQTK